MVDRRADGLNTEYVRKLHEKDMAWCGTAAGSIGPLEAVLQSHGALRGLVFGAVGEASKEVERLLTKLANLSADGLSDVKVGKMAWHMRRTLAMSHWRGLAELIRDRKSVVTNGGNVPRHERTRTGVGAEAANNAHARQQAAI